MTPKKSYYAMLGVLGLGFVVLIGAVVLGNTLINQQSAKLLGLKLENRVLDDQQSALITANKDIQKYADLNNVAKAIVPQDKDQAKTVREIVTIAKEANIPIASISFPSSTLGQAAPKTANTPDNPGSGATVKTPPVTQVKPVAGMVGVYQMEITIQSDSSQPVPYSAFIDFMKKLEKNRRTAQVSTITITPFSRDINLVTFSLGINVFIKP